MAKAWQLITHEPSSPTYRRLRQPIPESDKALYGSFRPTEPVLKAWTDTAAVARAMGATVVVFQCPPRFTPTPEHVGNLRKFFGTIDCTASWRPGSRAETGRRIWSRDCVRSWV
jgi:uncharacterized protein YecE (DUF72 family)